MKDNLEILIKLQKTYVDEQRSILAKLYQQMQAIDLKIAMLEGEKESQEGLLHEYPDMGMTYADYLTQYFKKRAAYNKEQNVMVKAIEMAQEKLAVQFGEQKRYEIAQTQRLATQRQEEAAQETKTLDEVGSVGFMRKKG